MIKSCNTTQKKCKKPQKKYLLGWIFMLGYIHEEINKGSLINAECRTQRDDDARRARPVVK